MLFRDRIHPGQLLAAQLRRYVNAPDLLVCALPRGGVVVGFQVAYEAKHEAKRPRVELVVAPTARAIEVLRRQSEGTNATLHMTC